MPPEQREPTDYPAMPPGFLEAIVHDLADPHFLSRQWARLIVQDPETADRLLGFANTYTAAAQTGEGTGFTKKSVVHLLLAYHYLPHALSEVRELESTIDGESSAIPSQLSPARAVSFSHANPEPSANHESKNNTAESAVLRYVLTEIAMWAEAQETETISLRGLQAVLRQYFANPGT